MNESERQGDANGFLIKDGGKTAVADKRAVVGDAVAGDAVAGDAVAGVNSPLEKAVKGDKKAFEILMGDYVKTLYNYVYARVPDEGDIEDIIQETMISAWKGIAAYGASSSFKTWLYGIANHKIKDYFRRRYRYHTETLEEIGEISENSDFTEHLAVKNDVNDALSLLDGDEKRLVHLIFNVGLNYSEISEIENIPVGTIKSRMSAIKTKLKKRLGEGYGYNG